MTTQGTFWLRSDYNASFSQMVGSACNGFEKFLTLSAKSSLILGENKAAFCRENEYTVLKVVNKYRQSTTQPHYHLGLHFSKLNYYMNELQMSNF